MAAIKGFRLIWQTPQSVNYFSCSNGQVEYSLRRKYRLEKKNAFDPTILHLRDEYREDSFDLQATLNPDEYYTLMSFTTAAGNLYLEYNAYNEVRDSSRSLYLSSPSVRTICMNTRRRSSSHSNQDTSAVPAISTSASFKFIY